MLAIATCQSTRNITDERTQQPGRPVGRLGRCCGVRPLVRPSAGSAQWATRHGCRVSRRRPWMADGGGLCRSELAREKPEGTAGCQAPRIIVDLHREQARSYRLFKVTRCKSGTIGGRYRRNGYVRNQQKTARQSGRHREQARSHRDCARLQSQQSPGKKKPRNKRGHKGCSSHALGRLSNTWQALPSDRLIE